MNTPDKNSPSADEKLFGALAHLFGPLVALIAWSTQKDKSRFVKFQALQALAFDMIIVIAMGIGFVCLFGVIFIGMFSTMFGIWGGTSSSDTVPLFFMLSFMSPFLIFACISPSSLLFLAVRLFASFSVLNGHNFQYPLLGKWLENFMKE